MKNYFIFLFNTFIIFLAISNNLYSQVELVKDNLEHPTGIAFHGDRAYATLQGQQPHTGKIVSFEINNPEATYEVLLDSLSEYPRSIAVSGNDLFIGFTGYIGKMTINDNPFELEVFSFNPIFPRCLEVYNDKLYVAENNKISYYDLVTLNKTILIDSMENSPLSLAIKNDILYYSSENNLLKVNLNMPTEIDTFYTDFDHKIYAISIIGNEMYVDQTYLAASSREIIKIDLTNPLNSLETVVSGIGSAIDINYHEGSLYFVSPLEPNNGQVGKIFKVSEEIITNTHLQQMIEPVVFPNPAMESIEIKGIKERDLSISILNQNGQFIRKVVGQSKLDVFDLNQGIYYLEIEEFTTKQKHVTKLIKF